MTAISQKSRFWGHPQKRLCIARKFCVRFSSLFALILRIAPIFSRNRQGLFLPHGKSASKKEKPTPFIWRGWLLVLFGSYRSLRVQVPSGKIMSSKSSLLAAKYCIISHSSFPNDSVCSIALFAWSRKKLPANFTNSLHIFVQPVKPGVSSCWHSFPHPLVETGGITENPWDSPHFSPVLCTFFLSPLECYLCYNTVDYYTYLFRSFHIGG